MEEEQKDFKTEFEKLMLVMRFMESVEFEFLANTVTRAETIGPIFEPTAWINGGSKNLRDQGAILDAIRPAWLLAQKLKKEQKEANG